MSNMETYKTTELFVFSFYTRALLSSSIIAGCCFH